VKIKLNFKISDFLYTAPIVVQKQTILKNQVLHVSILKNDELLSQVDLISLPHFHHYNLFEWRYVLEKFFKENDIDESLIKLDLPFFNMIKSPDTNTYQGELLNIVESILFKIIESLNPSIINFIELGPIKMNGLYNSSLKMDTLPECLKIKIRPDQKNLQETGALIKSLLTHKPDIKLRLDGNRCFELEELNLYMTKLNLRSSIEYIEEPFKNSANQYFFNYPIAIDESLIAYQNHLEQLANFAKGTTFILKPSIFGISKCFEICKYAKEHFYNVVISSSYETATGLSPLLYLAALNPKSHHGLDTLKFLPKDLGIISENFSLQF
jgi:hypothetical protein